MSSVRRRTQPETPAVASPRKKVPSYADHVRLVHSNVVDSPLTTTQLSDVSMFGIVNLCALLLFLHNLRLVIENLIKHGWLFGSWFLSDGFALGWGDTVCIAAMGVVTLPVAFVFVGELLLHKGSIGDTTNTWVARISCLLTLLGPTVLILTTDGVMPHIASLLLIEGLVITMKLFSFFLVNRDLRRAHKKKIPVIEKVEGVENPVIYPHNLTVENITYFLVAPTLCYQMNYPRTKKIRWGWVARRSLQMLFIIGLLLFVCEQYLAPSLPTAANALREMNVGRLLERILKLSVPCLYTWLLFFLVVFHYWLNILAELLRFGDRRFYGDWWNATDLGYYWRHWNLPVHCWCVRHVYNPARRRGLTRINAAILVFFVSAVAHELFISIPCKVPCLYAFFGMMSQLPLILLTEKYIKSPVYGNIFFWIVFCIVGQPLSVLLYYQSYLAWHSTNT